MKVSELLSLMSIALNDVDRVTYPVGDRLMSLNAGIRSLSVLRPDVCSRLGEVTLKPGVLQSFPGECEQFLQMCYRRDDEGYELPMALVRRQDWDREDDQWFMEEGPVREVAFDDRFPDVFWVWPGVLVSDVDRQTLLMGYQGPPPVLSGEDEDWPLKVRYVQPVVEYGLYWLFGRDSAEVGNAQRSQMHLSVFQQMAGAQNQVDAQVSPVTSDYKEV